MPAFALTKNNIQDAFEICQLRTSMNCGCKECMYRETVCEYIDYLFNSKPKDFYINHTFSKKEASKNDSLELITSDDMKTFNEELKEVYDL